MTNKVECEARRKLYDNDLNSILSSTYEASHEKMVDIIELWAQRTVASLRSELDFNESTSTEEYLWIVFQDSVRALQQALVKNTQFRCNALDLSVPLITDKGYYVRTYCTIIETYPKIVQSSLLEIGFWGVITLWIKTQYETANKLLHAISAYDGVHEKIRLFQCVSMILQKDYTQVNTLTTSINGKRLTSIQGIEFWAGLALLLQHIPIQSTYTQGKNEMLDDVHRGLNYLHRSIYDDYKPVECLNIIAYFKSFYNTVNEDNEELLVGGFIDLERVIDIKYDMVSMFNYAMYMKQSQQYHAMQQTLLFILEGMNDVLTQAKPNRLSSPLDQIITTIDANFIFINGNAEYKVFAQNNIDKRSIELYLADACIHTSNYTLAKKMFENALGYTIDNIPPRFEPAQVVSDYVLVLLETGFPSKAVSICDLYLQSINHNDLTILMYRADGLLCLEDINECKQAMVVVQEAMNKVQLINFRDDNVAEYHAKYMEMLNNYALVLYCHNDSSLAITTLQSCIEKYPSSVDAKYNLTLILYSAFEYQLAFKLWLQARNFSGKNVLEISNCLQVAKNQLFTTYITGYSNHIDAKSLEENELVLLDVKILTKWLELQQEPPSTITTTKVG